MSTVQTTKKPLLFAEVPDLESAGLITLSATALAHFDSKYLDRFGADRLTGSVGIVAIHKRRTFGLQARGMVASATQPKNSLALEIRCVPLESGLGPYDRTAGTLPELLGQLRDSGTELDWSVKAHAHRPKTRHSAVVALPLSLPPASLKHFHEVSGVRLAALENGGKGPGVNYQVEVELSGDTYFADSVFHIRSTLTADFMVRMASRSAELIGYAFF